MYPTLGRVRLYDFFVSYFIANVPFCRIAAIKYRNVSILLFYILFYDLSIKPLRLVNRLSNAFTLNQFERSVTDFSICNASLYHELYIMNFYASHGNIAGKG